MVRLAAALRDELIAHCRREYPKEACGILAGKHGDIEQVYPMTNVDQSPISYQMDPQEQLRLMKQLRERGQEMLAIYHSHTASDAYPSPVDVRLAVYPDVAYLLVSLKEPAHPELKSYRIQEGKILSDNLQLIT